MQTDSAEQARAPDPIDPSPVPAAVRHQRHRPEETVLYRLVEQHVPAFQHRLAELEQPLPAFVLDEFRSYLACGRMEHGFIRVKCDGCRHGLLAWPAACLLLQEARDLPLLRCPAHGRDRRPPGRPRDPAPACRPVGAQLPLALAHALRRTTRRACPLPRRGRAQHRDTPAAARRVGSRARRAHRRRHPHSASRKCSQSQRAPAHARARRRRRARRRAGAVPFSGRTERSAAAAAAHPPHRTHGAAAHEGRLAQPAHRASLTRPRAPRCRRRTRGGTRRPVHPPSHRRRSRRRTAHPHPGLAFARTAPHAEGACRRPHRRPARFLAPPFPFGGHRSPARPSSATGSSALPVWSHVQPSPSSASRSIPPIGSCSSSPTPSAMAPLTWCARRRTGWHDWPPSCPDRVRISPDTPSWHGGCSRPTVDCAALWSRHPQALPDPSATGARGQRPRRHRSQRR